MSKVRNIFEQYDANENGTLTSLEPLVVTASPLTLDQSTRQVLTLELKSKFSMSCYS